MRMPMKKQKATIGASVAGYDERNLESARYIVVHPEEFGGVDSFPVTWARSVINRMIVK